MDVLCDDLETPYVSTCSLNRTFWNGQLFPLFSVLDQIGLLPILGIEWFLVVPNEDPPLLSFVNSILIFLWGFSYVDTLFHVLTTPLYKLIHRKTSGNSCYCYLWVNNSQIVYGSRVYTRLKYKYHDRHVLNRGKISTSLFPRLFSSSKRF